jgi:hypothetical protein
MTYEVEDSLSGSLSQWIDVSATRTLLAAVSEADDGFEELVFTNVVFPFYGVREFN